MRSDQSASGDALLISTKELSEFLDVTETFARKLMKSLNIPKRRKGYPKLRLFAAFGFEAPFPIHAPDIWLSLLDVPAAAKATGEGEKTIGRMFEGSHKDKSFTNYLFLGPRKRVIFPFEAEAWLSGIQPEYIRKKELMHPYLRRGKASARQTSRHEPEPAPEGPRSSATALFLSPRSKRKTSQKFSANYHLDPISSCRRREPFDAKRHNTGNNPLENDTPAQD